MHERRHRGTALLSRARPILVELGAIPLLPEADASLAGTKR
jgi:hypothetical protein